MENNAIKKRKVYRKKRAAVKKLGQFCSSSDQQASISTDSHVENIQLVPLHNISLPVTQPSTTIDPLSLEGCMDGVTIIPPTTAEDEETEQVYTIIDFSTENNEMPVMEYFTEDEFEEIKIPVPWGHISGKWWGSRQVQPIIAIHGWQDNSGSFDNLAPILRDKGLSLLCIDLPGHGFSSHFPSGQYYYIFWDGIHILRRIVKHFNFKQITILGHSLGGGIAFLYAATFPEEVKRYVSLDIASPSVRDPKKLVNILGNSVDKFLFYDSLTEDQVPVYEYDDMVQIMFEAHAGSLTKESSEVMLRRGIKRAERGNGFVFTRDPRLKVPVLGFISIEQTLELASRITCEVLNVRAKPGTKFDFPEYYQMVLDAIQDSAKKVVRKEVDGTHHVHLNDAKVVADAICNFLTD